MIFRILVLLSVLIISITGGCDSNQDAKNSGDDVNLQITTPGLNPLEDAMRLIDLKHSDLVRPLFLEAGYHLIGRNPTIDKVAMSPFYLHSWTDDTSSKLQHSIRKDLPTLLSSTIAMINGGVDYTKQIDINVKPPVSFFEAYQYLCRRYKTLADDDIRKAIRKAGFTRQFDRQLGQLVVRLTDATILTQKAFTSLNQKELDYLTSRPERFFYPQGLQFNFLTAPTHVQQKIIAITRKIEFKSLFSALLLISEGISDFTDFINSLNNLDDAANYFINGRKPNGLFLDVPTPVGNIVFLGQDGTIYNGNGALVIDLGGNDRYTGPIAVGHLIPGRVSVTVDIGGKDIYDQKNSRFSQGFGCLSIAMLVDLSGDDQYLSGDMAQGSGIYGVGIIADLKGNDYYKMGLMGQGFGVFGIGLLVDADGNDKYVINAMGQGAGSTMGFGGLVDIRGDDKYLADRTQQRSDLIADELSHVQGAGLSIRSPDWTRQLSIYGGIGFLSDGGGNDFYYASNGNSMGSSYFMSIGALVDHGGNDKYIPAGGYALGFAEHLSNAALIDRKGDDYYFGKNYTGGVGSDRSIAILIDYEGDDVYGPSPDFGRRETVKELEKIKTSAAKDEFNHHLQEKLADVSYASALKPKALGFLIDYQGNDRYFARQRGIGESCGGVIPPVDPSNWSHALLLDLGGKDFYSMEGRKDNHYFKYFEHGICYDTDYHGQEKIGKTQLIATQYVSFQNEKLISKLKNNELYLDLRNLFDPDLFVRYEAIGKITQNYPLVISDLIDLLSESQNNELNRDIIEILNTFIIGRQITRPHGKKFEFLLKAKDPYVRHYAARALGWRRIKHATPALVDALGEKKDQIRSAVVWALGQIGSSKAIRAIVRIANTDSSLECRRSAMSAIRILTDKLNQKELQQKTVIKETLYKGLADPDEIIRTHAASGLAAFGDDPEILTALLKSLDDHSIYVQRAAAKSVILNGSKAGIAVLIESLKFPSIDTFEHYDHELAKDLAFYCGIDFDDDQRYSYHTWMNWWYKNGSAVDLKKNLAIMKQINTAFEAKNEAAGIAIFNQLMAQNPANRVVKKRFKRFCYEWITYRLLTQERKSPKLFKRVIGLQKILTALNPDKSQTWAQLATYYAKVKQIDDAIAAVKTAITLEPENAAYQKALKNYIRYKTIQND
jgi:hypothetical protein